MEIGGSAAPEKVIYLSAVPKPSISAFFPCYNDANSIGDLVRQADCVPSADRRYGIIVVNDGSRTRAPPSCLRSARRSNGCAS